jgi:hypothetical protein
MPLQLHANDCSREAKPGIWIFSGRLVVLLVIGVAAFIVIVRTLANYEVDWIIAIPVALLPLGAMTLFVWLIRDKAPSWAWDALAWNVWRLKVWLYFNGARDRPPVIWLESKTITHPNQF